MTRKPHCNFLDNIAEKSAQILKEKQKRWRFNFVEEKPLYTKTMLDQAINKSPEAIDPISRLIELGVNFTLEDLIGTTNKEEKTQMAQPA